MQTSSKKLIIAVIVVVVLGGVFAYLALRSQPAEAPAPAPEIVTGSKKEIIGTSVEGRAIESYTYGDPATSEKHLLFVGGIHGGYEWNSALLAYEFMDYLDKNPSVIPNGLAVSVIPSANPDGVFKVIKKEGRFSLEDTPTKEETEKLPAGEGRFNANGVDLNRNFDCKWQPKSTWRSKEVSAGTEAFSEPEAQAIKKFVDTYSPDAVVFWHSQANAVYASECENGILPETLDVMNAYAKAAGYPSVDSFDAYPVSGDAEGWLASIGIPAITVELKTHETVEWQKNIAGIKALFNYYNVAK